MRLPSSPLTYDQRDQNEMRRTLALEDQRNQKRDTDFSGRVVLTSANGKRFYLTVANDGTLSAEPI